MKKYLTFKILMPFSYYQELHPKPFPNINIANFGKDICLWAFLFIWTLVFIGLSH